MALRDLEKVLSTNERERLNRAGVSIRSINQFYSQAHADIAGYIRRELETLAGRGLSPAIAMRILRLSTLMDFIEQRVAQLNVQVARELGGASTSLRDLIDRQVIREARALGISPDDFGTPDVSVLDRHLRDAVRLIRMWNSRIRSDVLHELRNGFIRGEGYDEIAKRVATRTKGVPPVARARSHALANTRYAVVRAANAGREESYKQAEERGVDVRKMWWAAIDSCCSDCAKLHGTIVDQSDDFPWRDLDLRITPYREELPHPPAHPNCRCRIIPITADILNVTDLNQVRYDRDQRLQQLRRSKAI